MLIFQFHRKTTEEAVNLERDPSSASMASSVTFSTTMSTASNVAKRSYTSNTLATDVSEVNIIFFYKIESGKPLCTLSKFCAKKKLK